MKLTHFGVSPDLCHIIFYYHAVMNTFIQWQEIVYDKYSTHTPPYFCLWGLQLAEFLLLYFFSANFLPLTIIILFSTPDVLALLLSDPNDVNISKLITPHLLFKINSLCFENLHIKALSSLIKIFRAPHLT